LKADRSDGKNLKKTGFREAFEKTPMAKKASINFDNKKSIQLYTSQIRSESEKESELLPRS